MTDSDAGAAYPRPGVAWYAVAVLIVAYTFSFIDRTIVALLIPAIKADLAISDTMISLLHGFAFAIFYTTLGIPIARLSDRVSRKKIIIVSTVIWSAMTAFCGLSSRYWQLFAARVGVGIGEAALSPAAYSLIADLFPRDRLSRALSAYSAGAFLGGGLAFLIGGWVVGLVLGSDVVHLPLFGDLKPWQAAFVIVGVPGIAIAAWLGTILEPPRHGADGAAAAPAFGAVLARLRAEYRAYGAHFLGFALIGLVFNGYIAWNVTLLVRSFAYAPGQAGMALGAIMIVTTPLGIWCGGTLADALMKRGLQNGTIWVGVIAGIGMYPFAVAAPVMTSDVSMLALLAGFYFFASFPYGAAAAALQLITPNRMRAQVSALYLLVLNLLGIGFGPTLIALINDYAFGGAALGRAMMLAALVVVPLGVAVLFLGRGAFTACAQRHRHSG